MASLDFRLVYQHPDKWRKALAQAQHAVALCQMVLAEVEAGNTIITGERPHVIYWTGPPGSPEPLSPQPLSTTVAVAGEDQQKEAT